MRKDVLQCIRELESVDVSETVLDVGIDDELRETENFATQVESISEARLLALLRGESFDGLINKQAR